MGGSDAKWAMGAVRGCRGGASPAPAAAGSYETLDDGGRGIGMVVASLLKIQGQDVAVSHYILSEADS